MKLRAEPILNRMMLAPGLTLGAGDLEGTSVLTLEPASSRGDQILVSTDVTGWSPMLHKGAMRWRAKVASTEADDIATALQPFADLQIRRAKAAEALGLPPHPAYPGITGHIRVDRLLKAYSPALAGTIEHQSRQLADRLTDGLSTRWSRDGVSLMDSPDADPAPTALIRVRTPWGWYDGETVTLDARAVEGLPETIVAAMPGRRVGDLVASSPTLRQLAPLLDRTVVSAVREVSAIQLATTPDWVRLG